MPWFCGVAFSALIKISIFQSIKFRSISLPLVKPSFSYTGLPEGEAFNTALVQLRFQWAIAALVSLFAISWRRGVALEDMQSGIL